MRKRQIKGLKSTGRVSIAVARTAAQAIKTAIAKKTSQAERGLLMTRRKLVLCLQNAGYEASLERRKIYSVLADRAAAAHQQLRVIDESGEDYLYPAAMFAPIQLPRALRRAVLAAV